MHACLVQRGKWRPKLFQLVTSNSDSAVQDITRQASSILLDNDNDNDSSDSGSAQERPRPRARPQPRRQDRNNPAAQLSRAESALNVLCNLKGVGPATASLLLSLLTDPRTLKPPPPSSSNSSSVQPILLREPFMSDESFAIVLPSAKAEYTLKSWREWRKAMALRINEQVNGTRIWSDMAQLERACYAWTWYKVETVTRDEDVESPARSSELKYESKEMKRKRGGEVRGEVRDKGHDEAQVDTSDKKGKRARR